MTRKRIHHVGIVLPTIEAVDDLMTMFDLEGIVNDTWVRDHRA